MAAFSRRITGWSIAARQDTDLVINALSRGSGKRDTRLDGNGRRLL
jgi:hypothetical protein